ncbi:MAG TPA: 3-isopropylmalate dehydratase [candidate division Zixibacteria bacterium]|nr:3-isopropylmalate dehydratase [candidate division Zixibacteria bacterium]
MIIEGKIFKYGDDVNTDVIFPGKYTYEPLTPEQMAEHALEDLDPSFREMCEPGDVIVAGKNFGCGSSREQAAIAIRTAGCKAIIAPSFARIFYRNCLNSGLFALTNDQIQSKIKAGDRIRIDIESGIIEVDCGTFHFPKPSDDVVGLLLAGGLIPFTRKKLEE